MRLIDADALIEVIKKSMAENPHKEEMQRAMHIHEHKYFLTLLAGIPTIQPVATDTNVGDKISKFIDGLEETFAYIREREGGDSVCGLCEYDGAYIGESGDWCNECPGFNRDDCFKLSDETRRKWTAEIINAQPTIQPEPQWIPVSERLPEDGSWNIFTDGKNISVERYKADAIDHFFPNGRWFELEDVIAWMPLPEPYKPNNE